LRLFKQILLVIITVFTVYSQDAKKAGTVLYSGDNGDGTYSNPVINADYSDPDAIRVGTDYYMTASSLNCIPGLPILHSKDLVNWELITYAIDSLPSPFYDKPQPGKGVWAPSIRYHDAKYYIFFSDPDFGIYVTTSLKPEGPWSSLKLIKAIKGWIDPCPLWDDDGKMYLVHAWAKSRVGFNSILTVRKMDTENLSISNDSVNVFDGHKDQPTIEGPKFYKRNGFYYIFAPAGGVEKGWQVALRSKNVFGPYEDKIVLQQGSTFINGPHQGAWVETPGGESWFLHFQKKGAYGRVVHLQPLAWEDEFPKIGLDYDGNLIGEPVQKYKKPALKSSPIKINSSFDDEFDSPQLNLAWQWNANFCNSWFSLKDKNGALRLLTIKKPDSSVNMWDIPNLLLQKFQMKEFSAVTELDFHPQSDEELSGLIIMGKDYSYLAIRKVGKKYKLIKVTCLDADKSGKEIIEESVNIPNGKIQLKAHIKKGALCDFYFSPDGNNFKMIGKEFTAKEGYWIGAKVGLFALSNNVAQKSGYADYEYFRIQK
jgi:beta-xylosidase